MSPKIKISIKYLPLTILGIIFLAYYIPKTLSQTTSCGTSTTYRATGLVSTPTLSSGSKFYTSTEGKCIVDSTTVFAPFKIRTFADLKSLYFDQAKDNPGLLVNKNNPITGIGPFTQANIPMGTIEDQLYYIEGDLNISSEPTGSRSGIVFVSGNLTIDDPSFAYGGSTSGIVFIVLKDVNILTSVTQVDAVITSSGTICTASTGSPPTCPATNLTASQLVINGSLMSLDSTKPIKFRRTLSGAGNDTTPAEKINFQPKYLVLLRNLLSETLQKWSEITIAPQFPSLPPTAIDTDADGVADASDCAPTDASRWQDLTGYGGADTDLDTYRVGAAETVCSGSSLPSGYSSIQDCNDTSDRVFQNVSVAKDADNDGFSTTSTTSTQCVGTSSVINTRTYYKDTAAAFTWWNSASEIADCNDANAILAPSRTTYTDNDNDNYTLNPVTGECTTISTWGNPSCTTDGSRFAKNSASTCVSIASLGTDCYDSNANANPDQISYFTFHRGDNSFDYDCSETEEKQYNCLAEWSTTFACSTTVPGFDRNGYIGVVPPCGGNANIRLCADRPDSSCSSGGSWLGMCSIGCPSGPGPFYQVYDASIPPLGCR